MTPEIAPMTADEVDETLVQMQEDGYNVSILSNGNDETAVLTLRAYDLLSEVFADDAVEPFEAVAILTQGVGDIANSVQDAVRAVSEEEFSQATDEARGKLLTLGALSLVLYDAFGSPDA